MTQLIAISVGPVQDFIAAARRTNDLYAGSELLSRIATEAARTAESLGAKLIFPADPDADAANKILAEFSGDPKPALEKIRRDAEGVLRDEWRQVAERYGKHLAVERGDKQVAGFLEFFAAWYPWDGTDATYPAARLAVERLLAGRKALREFVQPEKNNVPKSPLDPSRDSVVAAERPDEVLGDHPFRLKPNEQLDAVSLVKRGLAAKRGGQTPSTVDIAARTYLADRPAIAEQLRNLGVPEGAVFPGRRAELVEEGVLTETDADQIAELVRAEPNPYFAILVADGDRMGAKIGELKSADEHRRFSRQLADFAASVGALVRELQGFLVYAGGDDVLAFLPVHTALDAAARLAESFHKQTGLNMTVGLAVVHYREPLYLTLAEGRRVEKEAKRAGRNRLRVEWIARGGQNRTADWEWSRGFDLAEWNDWREAVANGLSRGFAYELAALARNLAPADLPPALVRAEAERVLKRKERDGARLDPSKLAVWQDFFTQDRTAADLGRLAELLVLLHTFAHRTETQEDRS
ncbi:MAG: type III-B CRISPR-associated protein Cas10/Cmr2 [Fimbriimonadaceae bacterium]